MENKTTVNIDKEVEMIRKYEAIRDEAAGIVESLRQVVKDKMEAGNVEVLVGADYKATYKTYKTVTLDKKLFQATLPDVAKQFEKESEQKRLYIR